jgi:hypothetical protein
MQAFVSGFTCHRSFSRTKNGGHFQTLKVAAASPFSGGSRYLVQKEFRDCQNPLPEIALNGRWTARPDDNRSVNFFIVIRLGVHAMSVGFETL